MLGVPAPVEKIVGGIMNLTLDGNLKANISLMVVAACDLVTVSLGNMPRTAMLIWGCLWARWLVADIIVSAILWHSLELPDFKLLLPMLIMHLSGFDGIPP